MLTLAVVLVAAIKKSEGALMPDFYFFAAVMLCRLACAALEGACRDEGAQMFWYHMGLPFTQLSALAFLLIVLRFFGLSSYHRASIISILCIFPACTLLIAATNDSYGFFTQAGGGFLGIEYFSGRGPWFYIHICNYYMMLVAAIVITLSRRKKVRENDRRYTLLILLGSLAVVAGGIFDILYPGMLRISISLCVSALLVLPVYLSSVRYNDLSFLAGAQDSVFGELDEAIFVLDEQRRIINRNLSSDYLLYRAGADEDEVSYQTIFDRFFADAKSLAGGFRKGNGESYTISGDEGELVYNVKETPVLNKRGRPVGYIVAVSDVTASYAIYKQLDIYAGVDALTGLANRRGLRELADGLAHDPELFPVAVILGKVRGLREVNDEYGYHQGNIYLIDCTETIKTLCPSSSSFARISGDDFLILIPGATRAQAMETVRDISRSLEKLSRPYRSAVDFGISSLDTPSDHLDRAMEEARAMLERERAGR